MRVRRARVRGGGRRRKCRRTLQVFRVPSRPRCPRFRGKHDQRIKTRSPRPRAKAVFASKRVKRFERRAFTLATCEDTHPAVPAEPISCDPGKGVTNTATTPLQIRCSPMYARKNAPLETGRCSFQDVCARHLHVPNAASNCARSRPSTSPSPVRSSGHPEHSPHAASIAARSPPFTSPSPSKSPSCWQSAIGM